MKKIVFIAFILAVGSAHADFGACMNAVSNESAFAPIASKLATGLTKTQTFAMLANTDRPSDSERPIIASWVTARGECYAANTDWLGQFPIPIQNLALKSRTQFESAAADLYNGKLTYGGFAARRAEIASEYTIGANDARQANDRERQAYDREQQALQASQNEQRRQAALQILKNNSQTVPYEVQHPTLPHTYQSNCTNLGGMISCTTR